MKFSSSGYPSQKNSNSKILKSSRANYTPRVRIPNYTTSSYNSLPNQRTTPPRNETNYYDNLNNYSTPTPENRNPVDSQYNVPIGVPLMPLYGYDNLEDSEKDWGYFRQMYPNIAQKILREIDKECDKLEYDGSCMFDEYPDKIYLGRIVEQIYEEMQDVIEEPIVYTKNLKPSYDCKKEEAEVEIKTSPSSRRGSRNPVRSNNWLKDLIEILLYQEVLNRRRRYRSRRRWF